MILSLTFFLQQQDQKLWFLSFYFDKYILVMVTQLKKCKLTGVFNGHFGITFYMHTEQEEKLSQNHPCYSLTSGTLPHPIPTWLVVCSQCVVQHHLTGMGTALYLISPQQLPVRKEYCVIDWIYTVCNLV